MPAFYQRFIGYNSGGGWISAPTVDFGGSSPTITMSTASYPSPGRYPIIKASTYLNTPVGFPGVLTTTVSHESLTVADVDLVGGTDIVVTLI